jgi:hypothetical protein
MIRMRSHSSHLPDQAPEKETDRQEGINGLEEEEGEGNKDGNHQGCRMWATVLGEVITVVEEAITEVDVVDTEGNMVEEEATEGRTEEMDHKVKVDGNHVGGTMDLLHLVDLDLGVHLGGSVPRHLPDVDHLVLHLDVENHPQLDDVTTHHLEGDVLMTRHLDEPLLHEGAGMMIPHPGELGMIHPQLGGSEIIPPHPHPEGSETIPPLLESPRRTIHLQEDVETIHHLVELLGEMLPDPDPGRGPRLSHLLVDAEEVQAEAGVERGLHHLKLGGGEVLPHLYLVQMLRMPRWTSQMGMGMAMLR